jgi:hypothetical protein
MEPMMIFLKSALWTVVIVIFVLGVLVTLKFVVGV